MRVTVTVPWGSSIAFASSSPSRLKLVVAASDTSVTSASLTRLPNLRSTFRATGIEPSAMSERRILNAAPAVSISLSNT